MTSDNVITIGEISRRLKQLDRQMGQGFAKIDSHLNSLQFVHRETYAADMKTLEAKHGALQSEIIDLKDKNKWISRSVAGALITAVVAAIAAAAAGGVL